MRLLKTSVNTSTDGAVYTSIHNFRATLAYASLNLFQLLIIVSITPHKAVWKSMSLIDYFSLFLVIIDACLVPSERLFRFSLK